MFSTIRRNVVSLTALAVIVGVLALAPLSLVTLAVVIVANVVLSLDLIYRQ